MSRSTYSHPSVGALCEKRADTALIDRMIVRDYAQLDTQDGHLDPESLEQRVLMCLEGLAKLAQTHGQQRRAAPLLDAAVLLREEAVPVPIQSATLTQRERDTATLIARGW